MTDSGLFGFFRKNREAPEATPARPAFSRCQICGSSAAHLDTVDFNKSCLEDAGRKLPASGKPIHYYLCPTCGFCFAPDIQGWTQEQFAQWIYNDEYEYVDPDYVQRRPMHNAEWLEGVFGASKTELRHLDYGGGSGVLSGALRDQGWDSTTYDPFATAGVEPRELGQFDLVTAFEVFEHVADVSKLLDDLIALCRPVGLILFTTSLSDGKLARGRPLTWWYASPRNGHISLFSSTSLNRCLTSRGLVLGKSEGGMHAAWREVPPWAAHLSGAAALPP